MKGKSQKRVRFGALLLALMLAVMTWQVSAQGVSYNTVDCVTLSNSTSGEDKTIRLGCSGEYENYTLVGCAVTAENGFFQKSYGTQGGVEKCSAQDNEGGGNVTLFSRCCKLEYANDCYSRTNFVFNSNPNNKTVPIECDEGYKVVGCGARAWKKDVGMDNVEAHYVGTLGLAEGRYNVSSQNCTAVPGPNTQVYTYSRCCRADSGLVNASERVVDAELDCHAVWSNESGVNPGDYATTDACDTANGYFLTDCGFYGTTGEYAGNEMFDSHQCRALVSKAGADEGVRAVATCCREKLWTVATDAPSMHPSMLPSMLPSMSPSSMTLSPSMIPSKVPSMIPSMQPSTTPSMSPTQSPTAIVYNDVDCATVTNTITDAPSSSYEHVYCYDDEQYENYTMVGCSVQADNGFQTAEFSDEGCRALVKDGGEVTLFVRCCNLGYTGDCVNEASSSWSGTGDDDSRTETCTSGYKITGCGVRGRNDNTQDNVDAFYVGSLGSSSAGSYSISSESCKAINDDNGGGVKAHARCCQADSAKLAESERVIDAELDCYTEWSDQSGTSKGDSTVTSSCDTANGYFLTDCGMYGTTGNYAGARMYSGSQNCRAYITEDKSSSQGVYAVATCCREVLTTVATDAPTMTPSLIPSNDPSMIPSMYPSRYPNMYPTAMTDNPSEFPSAMPSYGPSKLPSRMPSSQPSESTESPTTHPTSMPTMSPVDLTDTVVVVNSNVECVTVANTDNDGTDDSNCANLNGYTLVGCGAYSDGDIVRSNRYAFWGSTEGCEGKNVNGNDIEVYARCCKLDYVSKCESRSSQTSSAADFATVTSQCREGYESTACTVHGGSGKAVFGSYAGSDQSGSVGSVSADVRVPTDDTCTGQNSDDGWGVNAIVRCCAADQSKTKSNDLVVYADLECYSLWGAKSGANAGDTSMTVACDVANGYFLSGCSFYGDASEGSKFFDSQQCQAINANGGKGVYAVATCCRERLYVPEMDTTTTEVELDTTTTEDASSANVYVPSVYFVTMLVVTVVCSVLSVFV